MENISDLEIKRGHIYYVDFGQQPGSAVHGIRPAIVLQNDTGNRHAPTVIVAAITSEIKKLRQPTHVVINIQSGLPKQSMILLEQIVTVDKQTIGKHLGCASEDSLGLIDRALAVSVGLPSLKRKMSNEEKAQRRERRTKPKVGKMDAL